MPRKNHKDRASDFEAYLSSRDSLWFWLSYAFISAFFVFSLITTENTLILFIKRAIALIFTFIVPGYVITKAIYPKDEIDAIERFAFSVAFSVTFVMFTAFILNYVGITHFSLLVATFPLALIFTTIATLRSYHTYKEKPDLIEKKESNFRGGVIPLALIAILVFLIKIYEPITEPRAGFIDTYLFTIYTQSIISKGAALPTIFPFSQGYVPGYFLVIAFLKFFLDTSVYEIMRYAHVFSFLSVIPAYLFARHVFKSRRIALLAVTFMFSTRWMFMRTSISNAESMSHFFVILFLLMLLKTIENPTVKNCLITSLLLSSTVLEYHMTLQFLVPFIIIIFIFLATRHLFTKTGPDLKEIIKTASLTVTPAVLISGFLWYFWNLDRFFYGLPATEYKARGFSTEVLFNESLFLELTYHVRHIGLFEVIFLCAGLILIVLHNEQRKNIRYQFLLIYLITLLFLIQSRFFGIKHLHIWYLFSWLAFPASMLAGYGFFSSMKAVHSCFIKLGITPPSPKIFLVLGIVLILLVNFNGFNYHWYKHKASEVYLFDERIFLHPGSYLGLQESVKETGFLSSYLYRDYYGFYYPISITLPEYEAFKEIKEHTTPDSQILLWNCRKAFMRGLSERSVLTLEKVGIEPDHDSVEILKKNLEYKFDKGLFTTDGSVVEYNTSIKWQPVHYDFPGGLDTSKYRFFEMRFKVDKGRLYVGVDDSNHERHEFIYTYSTNGKWETYRRDLYNWLKNNGFDTTIYRITLNEDLGSDISFNSTIDWISIHTNNKTGIGFREDFVYTTHWKTDLENKFASSDKFILVGLETESPYGTCPEFSNETLASLDRDPNFRLIYQNEQIKIYNLTKDYTIFLNKPGGFREDFEDLFYWGSDLSERAVLRTDGDLAAYQALSDDQSIDVDFSTGLDTRVYPYFEARMKVGKGKISIGVYDSTGEVHIFLNNFTTNGKWETYKFNLHDWLSRNGYDTNVHGIKITNTLGSDPFFSSSFDWISIHNHIFWDVFEDESRIADMDRIVVDNGDVTLSKATVEILNNSGFENGFEGWRPGVKWSIDSEESHSGNKSAVLYGTVDPAADDPSTLLDSDAYRGILKQNTSYRFSAWVKGNVTDAVGGTIRQLGSADPWSEWIYFTQHTKTYDNWTYSEGIITTSGDINGDFYIRFYGGGNPAVWIDDILFGEEVYESSGTLLSTDTVAENPIISVKPMWTSTEPDGTDITIEISVDNGTTWTRAKNGVPISYASDEANKHLLHRAFFQTDDVRESPILHDIELIYEEKSPAQ